MKSIYSVFTSLVLIGTPALAASPYQAGQYNLDPMHSKVGFEIPHLVISTVEGRFNTVDGKIALMDNFEKTKIDANIDLASVDTGTAKRDEHLKSADFFDVAKYPKMTFKSTSIKGTPENFTLTGDLTLHGVTKKVTLESKYLGSVVDGYGNKKVAFQAKGKIHRKDFGLTWNSVVEAGSVVGDDVSLDLRIQAAQEKKIN